MTNREYIQSLDTKALAKLIERDYGCCSMCANRKGVKCAGNCVEGIIEWLETERDSRIKEEQSNFNNIYYNIGFDTIVGDYDV